MSDFATMMTFLSVCRTVLLTVLVRILSSAISALLGIACTVRLWIQFVIAMYFVLIALALEVMCISVSIEWRLCLDMICYFIS